MATKRTSRSRVSRPDGRNERFHALLCSLSESPVERELCFAKGIGRRWRFDFAIPARMIAVEIDGGGWVGGRHHRPLGATKDNEKMNTALLMGWRVFRFDWKAALDGTATSVLEQALRQEACA